MSACWHNPITFTCTFGEFYQEKPISSQPTANRNSALTDPTTIINGIKKSLYKYIRLENNANKSMFQQQLNYGKAMW